MTKEEILEQLNKLEPDELKQILGELLSRGKSQEKPLDNNQVYGKIKPKRKRKRKKDMVVSSLVQKKKKQSPKVKPFERIKNRPNLFIERGFDSLHKEDSELDKKLWQNRKPQIRGNRESLVTIECNKCHNNFNVSPSLIFIVDGECNYVCDDCIGV